MRPSRAGRAPCASDQRGLYRNGFEFSELDGLCGGAPGAIAAGGQLLGQPVAGWGVDAGRVQDAGDEVALGVGVGVPVLAVLAGEAFLEVRVVGAESRIGSQGVPEGDQRAGVRLVVLDQLQVMGARLGPWAQEVLRRDAQRALVALFAERSRCGRLPVPALRRASVRCRRHHGLAPAAGIREGRGPRQSGSRQRRWRCRLVFRRRRQRLDDARYRGVVSWRRRRLTRRAAPASRQW